MVLYSVVACVVAVVFFGFVVVVVFGVVVVVVVGVVPVGSCLYIASHSLLMCDCI